MSEITSILSNATSSINRIYENKQDIISPNGGIQRASEQMALSTGQVAASQEEEHAIVDNVNERIKSLHEMAKELEKTVGSFKI